MRNINYFVQKYVCTVVISWFRRTEIRNGHQTKKYVSKIVITIYVLPAILSL